MTSSKKFQYSTSANDGLLFTAMTESQASTTKPVEGEWAYQITNTPLTTETSLTVSKEWYNHLGDDPTLYEQAQVTIKLLANGKDAGRTVTLSLKNGWKDGTRAVRSTIRSVANSKTASCFPKGRTTFRALRFSRAAKSGGLRSTRTRLLLLELQFQSSLASRHLASSTRRLTPM